MKTIRAKKMLTMALGVILSANLFVSGCSGKEDGTLTGFEAETLSGDSFTQDDLEEVDVTVFHFWSLRCGPCIREMPEIAKYAGKLPENVRMVTVCLDGENREERVKEILDNAGFAGTTLLAGGTFSENAGGFKTLCESIIYTPTTLMVDPDGTVVGDAIVGGQKNLEETYTEAINACLSLLGKEEIEIDE